VNNTVLDGKIENLGGSSIIDPEFNIDMGIDAHIFLSFGDSKVVDTVQVEFYINWHISTIFLDQPGFHLPKLHWSHLFLRQGIWIRNEELVQTSGGKV
jgi:hypothetical protein